MPSSGRGWAVNGPGECPMVRCAADNRGMRAGRRTLVVPFVVAVIAVFGNGGAAVALAARSLAASSAAAAHAAAVCADYPNQAAAQKAADTRDADGDGIYCED